MEEVRLPVVSESMSFDEAVEAMRASGQRAFVRTVGPRGYAVTTFEALVAAHREGHSVPADLAPGASVSANWTHRPLAYQNDRPDLDAVFAAVTGLDFVVTSDDGQVATV